MHVKGSFMGNDLISVIIPAFNAEEFIKRSIESVINQSYKNLEIIVVNDGSKDKTCEIVKQYNNVKLLNKENGGLCSARNFGVKHATGKYVVLLDADDYYEPDFVLNLHKHVSGKSDEIAMCDFLKNGKKESENCQYLEMNSKEQIFDQFLHGGIYNRTVNKIYPIELIKNTSFPEGKDMLEDAFFTSHALEKCNRAIRIPYAGYNYIRHEGTYTRNHLSIKQLSSMHSNYLEKDIYLSKYVSASEYEFLATKILDHIRNCLNALKDITIYEIYDKIYYLILFLKSINIANKKQQKFVNYMIKGTNPNKLKKQYIKYSVFVDGFRNKYLYFRNAIRKSIAKNK